ncbi:MAG: polymer-forming cytoskeletal protein [Nitrospira sp.]|nr:polymer-forming cytoskeletal protein [Nitrospira sp.]
MWENKKRTDSQDTGEQFTILGKDVMFKGVVRFEGTVQLDSCFQGEIHTNGTIVVGENAVVHGIIHAGTLISSGKIKGNVTASQKVHLLKPAVLIGDVHVPSFLMEEGAYFKGFTDMGSHPWTEESLSIDETFPFLTAQSTTPAPLLIENEPGN